ncbi:DNA-binding MarR family transcriptional regulator [Nocardioides luteus]|uniref:MarR family transcriptional regulator n=1 Tax=Nocardioides luteus TaxID=1844 RepID=A0ABQ5SRI7_9ACTN|nr:MarR family transcriptional regulator [Nocardioides luteus]MDR7313031.1 DNA-binding MarR family transcriptional regulator [Nocardioides luteus]GGR44555.1 MarR family transcriptional regulator [Nocardioides luteus]GLJ66092.1 MarR family transcriptional regulator [Nocardioides luteus]
MDVATLMFIAYRAMDDRIVSAMREAGYDITVAQARLAQRIAEDGSRLVDLAEQAQVTKQTASMLVAALEQKGYVERVPDPSDGRARLIRFTAEGQAAADHARELVMAVEQEWNDHLGPPLATALREALTSLRELVDPYR